MQELIFYVNAASALGICRDNFDAKTVALPTIIRGGEVLFRMRLFSGSSPREQYPMEALQDIVSWEWNMDADYDEDTPCKLVADNSAITVGEVEEERDGTTTVYTEIQIPVSQTNTVELRDWLSSAESKSDLSAELAGYDVDGKLAFILQLKGFTVRNRIVSAGTPTEIPDSYLDEAGVRALLAAGFEVQCAESADAEDSAWISATDAPDTYLWTRSRLRGNSAAAWSTPVKRLVGPQGPQGEKGDKGDKGDTADSIPWENITGKPENFPPGTHSHQCSDITDLNDATQSASGLMSAADKMKLDDITSGIADPETIPNSSDLNTFHSAGVYRMGSTLGALTITNCPVETAFSLIVLNPTLSGCVQILCEYGTGATFTRALKDSGQWSDWSKALNSESISENFGSSGYFKLPGGTIVQYGQALTSQESNSVVVTLPVAYTKNIYSIVASCGTANTPIAVTRAGSLTTITLYTPSPLDGATINWLTMGY